MKRMSVGASAFCAGLMRPYGREWFQVFNWTRLSIVELVEFKWPALVSIAGEGEGGGRWGGGEG